MCRWAAYIGEPIFVEDIVTKPSESLIRQSRHARMGKTEVNGDGFGLAWYGERHFPGQFRDIHPAWSDQNLRSLSAQIRSGHFLAHVRASTETATSRNNCHPFTYGRWSFMHNGQVGGFGRFRREVDMMIPDALYDHRMGATDSEALFLLAIANDLDADPKAAVERATGQLEALAREAGSAPYVHMTAAISDGDHLYAVRYASDGDPPTLYHERHGDGRVVVSEPLDDQTRDWAEIPLHSWAEITPGGVDAEKFVPQG
ncbi:MAG: class II glutamine amidotransferase [Pseudomonadota bacterium]